MKTIRGISSLAVGLAVAAITHTASAQTVVVAAPRTPDEAEVDRAGGSIAGVLGFGTHSGTGFALGVEGGYTLPMHLYIGGNFTYFTGSDDVTAYLLEGQIGYDLGVIKNAPVLIRPYVGLGYENFKVTCIDGFCPGSAGGLVLTPGVVGTYFITPHVFAGADVRLDVWTGTGGATSLSVFGTGGYKF